MGSGKDSAHEERDLALWRRKFDDLKAKTQVKGEHLVSMHDRLKESQNASLKTNQDSGNVAQPKSSINSAQKQTDSKSGGNSGLAKNIRILENKLDKAMIKFNEAMSIKKTYDVILNKLKEER